MKCPHNFGSTSMQEDTSAQLTGMGEPRGGRVIALVPLKNVRLCFKRVIKMITCWSLLLPKE